MAMPIRVSTPCRHCGKELYGVFLKPGMGQTLHCPFCGAASPVDRSRAVVSEIMDTRSLEFVCGQVGEAFTIIHRRAHPGELYTPWKSEHCAGSLNRLIYDEAPRAGVAVTVARRNEIFCSDEFDTSAFVCVWCGAHGSFLICPCGCLYCDGAAIQGDNGRLWVKCPICPRLAGYVENVGRADVKGNAACFERRIAQPLPAGTAVQKQPYRPVPNDPPARRMIAALEKPKLLGWAQRLLPPAKPGS